MGAVASTGCGGSVKVNAVGRVFVTDTKCGGVALGAGRVFVAIGTLASEGTIRVCTFSVGMAVVGF